MSRKDTNKRIYDLLVFGAIVFSLIFTSVAMSSSSIVTKQNEKNMYSDIYKFKAALADDVCDDCDDDDDDDPAINRKPTAYVTEASPNPSYAYQAVSFAGYGEDDDGEVVAYLWMSDINDILSENPSFSTTELTEGPHIIEFYVQDNEDAWSNPVEIELEVQQNSVPSQPEINGGNGGVGVEKEFTFKSTDPDGHDVYYYVEWGDDSIEEWVGAFTSSEVAVIKHTYSETGTYTVRAKAKDIYDAEGEWMIHIVQMPKARLVHNNIFLRLLTILFNKYPTFF